MIWKRLVTASAWAILVLITTFFVCKEGLTLWYEHTHSTDGQVGLSVLFGSFYPAVLSALVAFGIVLMRKR